MISVIIVDYKPNTKYLVETLEALDKQSYKNFEVIVIHDLEVNIPSYSWLKLICLGRKVGPAEKRDVGVKMAHGEIVAFLDDDAYPSENWLKEIVNAFRNPEVVGVGGPGVTPPKADFWEHASGWMSASPLGAGPYTYRFLPGKRQFIDDYPSMNLAVRKADFLKVGGYDSNYWPGEDTKLCLDLVKKLGKKIIYDPEALVYHHRRPLWKGHLKQNGNFGLHRGYFAKALPETSLRISYLLPSLMVLGIMYLVLSSFFEKLKIPGVYSLGLFLLCIYILALVANGIWVWWKSGSVLHGFVALVSVWVTQAWYGVRFVEGLVIKQTLRR